ncbi:putative proline permease protein [Neofusicoccum parvum UCRNP2]|uniref:Putative proline permease protein n=1 Tax=Botryosphaeria parva (strain UCR-NP2) TaxID=1287680 RepID=R1G1J3_BOTPV|nr:putative proline permease protein [Neofusicoccum parvum UCRNP2]
MANASHGKGGNEKVPGEDLSKIESCTVGESQLVEQAGTKRNIKSRHAQMIAIGGSIGTGLFVGSGQALAIGGPGILLLAYSLTAILVYGVVTAVIEVGTYLPLSGSSMAYHCHRFVSPSLGFALGWLYFYSFGIIVAYEITAAAIVIDYWPNSVHIAVWISIMMVVIIALNLSPVGVYAETEFWFASIKVIMIIGLLLLSLILFLGGGPTHDRLGFRYWNGGTAVKPYIATGAGGRFTSFLYVWVFSGFSFYFGPELIVFTSGEMKNPRRNLPIASRHFFWRLIVFYILGVLAIGVTCDSTSKGLTSGSGDANASPWVIAIQNAGISVLPSIINAGILTSAWSAGNAYLYMSSRSIYSLAVSGCAPKIFARCNRWGLPIYSVLAASCFAPLTYLSCGSGAGVVFNWLVSLTNTAGYTSWIVCTIIYLRFRKACSAQGVTVPYHAKAQPYMAWVSLFFFTILLLCNGFTYFYPGQFTVSGFLTTYIGIPLFLALWIGHKLVRGLKDPWMWSPAEVDLNTGIREVEADADMWTRMEVAEKELKGDKSKWWSKVSNLWE